MTILVDATSSYVSFNDGNFDTRYRYIRKTAPATAFTIVDGTSLDLMADRRNRIYKNGPRDNSAGAISNTATYIDVGTNTGGAGVALDISPSGFSIADPSSGRLLFDSSAPLMHVIAPVNGYIDFPQQNPSADINYSTTTTIATVDAIATHIIGSINTVYSGFQSSSTTGNFASDWWTINGTAPTYIQFGEIGTGDAANEIISNKQVNCVAYSSVTFKVVNGSVQMTERTSIFRLFNGGQFNPDTNADGSLASYIRQAYRMNYKLKAVAFS